MFVLQVQPSCECIKLFEGSYFFSIRFLEFNHWPYLLAMEDNFNAFNLFRVSRLTRSYFTQWLTLCNNII
ncbi:MAG: hypothetical protein HRT91_01360 [Piscirickettsiaceae bacterium]|nr:hypothetical protein [Piscirickettsiaceae bacterium]